MSIRTGMVAAAALILSGCPWDAEGNYTGERLPDGGIPASAYDDIATLETLRAYTEKYGGKRSRPRPGTDVLCSFWPSTAVHLDSEHNDGMAYVEVMLNGATTRAWVVSLLGDPPGGIGQGGRDTQVDSYRWDPVVNEDQGGITIEYGIVGGCDFAADSRDCDQWKIHEIRTLDPQVYLDCWRNAEAHEGRVTKEQLAPMLMPNQ